MDPDLIDHIHNLSAQYATGAATGVQTARRRVAELLGTDPASIVFTGGGSEAGNLALKGLFTTAPDAHLVTSSMEHPAGKETARWLERRGVDVTRIPPREDGRVDPLAVQEAIRPNTRPVSIMHVTNETGIVQPIEEIAQIATEDVADAEYVVTTGCDASGFTPEDWDGTTEEWDLTDPHGEDVGGSARNETRSNDVCASFSTISKSERPSL